MKIYFSRTLHKVLPGRKREIKIKLFFKDLMAHLYFFRTLKEIFTKIFFQGPHGETYQDENVKLKKLFFKDLRIFYVFKDLEGNIYENIFFKDLMVKYLQVIKRSNKQR